MTLAGSLEALCVAADALDDAFGVVVVTVSEDQPPRGGVHVFDRLAETMLGLGADARALRDGVRSVVLGPAAPSRREAAELLASAQALLNRLSDDLETNVTSCEQQSAFERAIRRGGREWGAWWRVTACGVDECTARLRDLRDALFTCWREMASGDGFRPAVSAPTNATSRDGATVVAARGEVSGRIVLQTLDEELRGGER